MSNIFIKIETSFKVCNKNNKNLHNIFILGKIIVFYTKFEMISWSTGEILYRYNIVLDRYNIGLYRYNIGLGESTIVKNLILNIFLENSRDQVLIYQIKTKASNFKKICNDVVYFFLAEGVWKFKIDNFWVNSVSNKYVPVKCETVLGIQRLLGFSILHCSVFGN